MSDRPTSESGPSQPASRRGLPIAFGLAAAIGLILLLTVAPTLLVGYETARRNTAELVRDKAELAIHSMEQRVRLHLDPVAAQLEYLGRLVAELPNQPPRPDALDALLRASLAASPQVSVIAFVEPDLRLYRVFRNRPQLGLVVGDWSDDADFRRIIDRAALAHTVVWEGFFFAQNVNQPYLNALLPLERDGRFVGALLAGISLAQLSDFVAGLAQSDLETAFILYGGEHVLAHPTLKNGFRGSSPEQPLPSLGMVEDAVLQRLSSAEPLLLGDRADRAASGLSTIDLDGERYLAVLKEVHGYGDQPWLLGSYMPLDAAAPQLARLDLLLQAGIAMLAMAAMAAAGLGAMLSRPIRHLAQAAIRVCELDLSGAPPVRGGWFRELREAAASFNAMLEALRWFEAYVPRQLVQRLMRLRSGQPLVSEEREVTVMFTDIAGFTALAEDMPAGDVAALLNRHFTLLDRCIESNGGIIDKFIGDAAMAFWGAPEADPAHARKACEAAVAIAEAVRVDNAARQAIGQPPLRLHIGIHTGRVVVGNIGAPSRMNYTLIGDAVNVAERLEGMARELGAPEIDVHVLVSHATADQAVPVFHFRHLGTRPLRGRHGSIRVYELHEALAACRPATSIRTASEP
ncbi:adenylate/guanylate cyclase domain-containing protein [Inquilinus sp. OTU3971]|uniref:adenylate/guanylate cyclase domain-containing protein n=1 Tax=Inquilinus sp. OTU3971 TaxID=3043855 RepID=UPI00313B8096